MRRQRQLGAETLEHFFEGRHNPHHDHRGHNAGHTQYRYRIEHRRTYLAFDRQGFFFVGGQSREQLFKNATLFTGRYQVAEQRIEVQRVAAKGLRQTAASFHIGADIQ